eukprot:GHVS01070468.1.p1 GENE.GHVS01070468.1~~GHVS01070468.1.p1  ORF type:complete len:427 (-),score=115.29 GHVS01070468.1:388-1626(-)
MAVRRHQRLCLSVAGLCLAVVLLAVLQGSCQGVGRRSATRLVANVAAGPADEEGRGSGLLGGGSTEEQESVQAIVTAASESGEENDMVMEGASFKRRANKGGGVGLNGVGGLLSGRLSLPRAATRYPLYESTNVVEKDEQEMFATDRRHGGGGVHDVMMPSPGPIATYHEEGPAPTSSHYFDDYSGEEDYNNYHHASSARGGGGGHEDYNNVEHHFVEEETEYSSIPSFPSPPSPFSSLFPFDQQSSITGQHSRGSRYQPLGGGGRGGGGSGSSFRYPLGVSLFGNRLLPPYHPVRPNGKAGGGGGGGGNFSEICCADCPDRSISCLAVCKRTGCKRVGTCGAAGKGAYAAFCQSRCEVIMGMSVASVQFLPDEACRGFCSANVQKLCAANSCTDHGCYAPECAELAPLKCV